MYICRGIENVIPFCAHSNMHTLKEIKDLGYNNTQTLNNLDTGACANDMHIRIVVATVAIAIRIRIRQ